MPSPPVDELHAWLALMGTPGIGRRKAARLLRHFGGPCELMHAGEAAWSEVLEAPLCTRLSRSMGDSAKALKRCLSWLAEDPRHSIVTLGDSDYPSSLLHSPDPPLLLYAAGDITRWSPPLVSVVGSRHATPQGLALARGFAQAISEAGIPVVSGVALGIDAAAHEGALQGTGSTIGVLGCGIDQVYPSRHHHLADRMMTGGLLVSEYPLGTPAIREHFPQRNRIIAWLSKITVVVEAAFHSGSLITARLAADAGRDVLAVPGPLSSSQSGGCNWLIKQGAGLLDHVNDIWESAPADFAAQLKRAAQDVRSSAKPARTPRSTGARPTSGRARLHAVIPTLLSDAGMEEPAPQDHSPDLKRLLQGGPASLDQLVEGSGRSASQWQEILLVAELQGLVGRLAGGRYQWLHPSPRSP